MKYELRQLEALIELILDSPCKRSDHTLFAAHITILKKETESLKKELSSVIINCCIQSSAVLSVHDTQYRLIGIIDMLESVAQKKPFANNYYPEIQECLLSLLNSIEQEFSEYFDYSYRIPEILKCRTIKENELLISSIRKLSDKQIEDKLVQFICAPFIEFAVSPPSFNNYHYLKIFSKHVKILLENQVTHNDIIQLLINLNYNSRAFFLYHTKELEQELYEDPATNYYYHLKILNRQPLITNLKYDLNQEGIKNMIGTWLTEEIRFLEREQVMHVSTRPTSISELNKLKTKLPVSQISLAVKLLLDTGIICNQNTTEVMRLVSRNFKTDICEQISELSLRKKAYNVEPHAVEGMKNVIVNLLNEVRKYGT